MVAKTKKVTYQTYGSKWLLFIFLLMFVLVFTGMHVYVLLRLLSWGGYSLLFPPIIITFFLILFFPLMRVLTEKFNTFLVYRLYQLSTYWIGIITLLFFATLLGEVMRVFISSQNVLFLVVAITFVASIYAIIHARTIRISTHTLQGSVSQSHKIAVASDIHADGLTGVSQIKRVVKRISSLNPDLVILPGDLLDGPGKLPSDLLKPFKTINKPIFFSLGNHDQYLPREEVQRVLKDSSIHLLQDEYHIIGELCIVGVSDREDREAVKKYCPRLPNNTYNILSYHRPDGLVDAKSKGVNLMVCGHTHNGQIFPFNLLTKTRFSHINGWYSLGQTMQYVSSGAGTWGPPMRLGSNSEVALINIVPK